MGKEGVVGKFRAKMRVSFYLDTCWGKLAPNFHGEQRISM